MKAADIFKSNNESMLTFHFKWFDFLVSFFTWSSMVPLAIVLIEQEELERRICQLRKKLSRVAEVTGLNSRDTLYCSQKLDQLIAIYQILYKKKKIGTYC